MTQLLAHAFDVELQRSDFISLDDGAPVRSGAFTVGTLGDHAVDVWEADPGHIGGVTTDEIFVVLEGRAEVTFEDTKETFQVGPGDIVRLFAGQRNSWTTFERIRKVSFYVPPAD